MRALLQVLQVRPKLGLFAAAAVAILLAGCGSAGSSSTASTGPQFQRSEGFNSNPAELPPAVAAAWNSVYLVLIELPTKYEIGSAYLMHKELGIKTTKLYFFTNRHVVEKFCPVGRPCPDSDLLLDGHLSREATGMHFEERDQPRNVFTVEHTLENPDFAVISIEVPNDQSTGPVLKIPTSCDLNIGEQLYAIGFPDPNLRTAVGAKPIDNGTSIIKRWSRGVYVDLVRSDDNHNKNTRVWMESTVDALGGNSGGPVLNSRGELVGMTQKSSSGPENNYRYTGNDSPGQLGWQSRAIPCALLSAIMSAI